MFILSILLATQLEPFNVRLTCRRGDGTWSGEMISELFQAAEWKAWAAARCRRLVMHVLFDEDPGQIYLRMPLPPVLSSWQPIRNPRCSFRKATPEARPDEHLAAPLLRGHRTK